MRSSQKLVILSPIPPARNCVAVRSFFRNQDSFAASILAAGGPGLVLDGSADFEPELYLLLDAQRWDAAMDHIHDGGEEVAVEDAAVVSTGEGAHAA